MQDCKGHHVNSPKDCDQLDRGLRGLCDVREVQVTRRAAGRREVPSAMFQVLNCVLIPLRPMRL
jgi:hypothetical protein